MSFDDLDLERLRSLTGKKWQKYGPEVIPAWVADMDFPVPEPIRRYLMDAVARSDFGYPNEGEPPLAEVFAERMARKFAWTVDPGRVEIIVDVVQGLLWMSELYARPGEGVVIQTPIYPPFLTCVADTRRRAVLNPMQCGEQGFEIDFDQLRGVIDSDTRMFFLCNPQNPTGRVLRRDELEQIAELAIERDLIVIADEIHADLLYDGREHIAFATLGPEVASRTITFTSATKAFNTAGLRCAVVVFGSERLQSRFNSVPRRMMGGLGSFGVGVTRIAWQECEDWLDELVAYLQGNRDFITQFIDRHLPGVRYHPNEATFLAWLDCRKLGLDQEPYDFFLANAGVALSEGSAFGEDGRGCARLNFANSRPLLSKILERMAGAVG